MKNTLLLCLLLTASSFLFSQDNPYEKYGFKPKIATMTNGKFIEIHDRDTIVQIGRIVYNTMSKEIIGFVEYDTAYSEATLAPDVVSRWLSPDPLQHMRLWVSPYNFVQNNPIMRIDPDGRLDGDYYDKEGNHLGSDGIDDDKVYTVEGTSKFSINDFKSGGKYHNNHTAFNENNGEGFSVNQLSISHSDFQDFSGAIYAEGSPWNTSFAEAAGIFSVIKNRSAAAGTTLREEFTRKNQVYGWSNRGDINSIYAHASSANNARAAVIAGLTTSIDYSGGGFYWHGTDFAKHTSGSRAFEDYYQVGFNFTNSSHDIWSLGSTSSGNAGWSYKYQSTGTGGQTTFMKLTDEWIKANNHQAPW